jgi:hypothetical protein
MQRITIYEPDQIENNGYLVQSVSIRSYAVNPVSNRWHLTMLHTPQNNWKAIIEPTANNEDTHQIAYFKDWRDFFTYTMPKRHNLNGSSYLTLNGASNHNIRWTWKQTNGKLSMENIAISKLQLYLKSNDTPYNGYNFKNEFAVPFTFNPISQNGIVELDEKSLTKIYYSGFSDNEEDTDKNVALAIEGLKSPQPDVAIYLLGMLKVISQISFNPSNIDSNSTDIYDIIHTIIKINGDEYTSELIDKHQVVLMRHLSKLCNGWWYKNQAGTTEFRIHN